MTKTKLNIHATLVHNVKGTLYKVNGILLSINESNDTCTMKFRGRIEKGIPMNKVLINEGFLDKIKEYGKKVATYITQKVKGFVALVDEATGKLFPWSLNNVANLAVKAAKGLMPDGVFFAPSPSLKQMAGVGGMSFDLAFAASMQNDRNEIATYWKRVINRTGTTQESIEESIKYINESYYKPNRLYKAVNEVVYSYDAIKDAKGFGQYGVGMNSKQLKAKLKSNIRNQISGPLGGHADVVPYLIWGAPGIGKTAIISLTIKELANSRNKPINLNLQVIMLAGYTIENWTLPRDNSRNIAGVNIESFTDTPKAWLPVYLRSSDPEENKKRDLFCNTCKFLSPEENGEIFNENDMPFEGGIVFMDEYSRVAPNVQNIIMGLGNDHKFGDNYAVASKWGFVFASNRSFDENEADSEAETYFPTAAKINRFKHVTYVPSKKEWIEWARNVDPMTHEANVPPFIVDFIEASPDYVWYSTVTNGGYDDMLDNPEADKRAHNVDAGASDAILSVLSLETLLKTKRMVTPRTWANTVGPEYKLELINLFDGNLEGLTGKDYYNKLVKDSYTEKTDENGHTYKEYYGGILPNLLVDALNDIDDDYWDEWFEEKGGEEILDPTGSLGNGIRGRYNIFMAWFIDLVRDSIGDDTGTNAFTATSPVIQSWNSYQSYAKVFTPEVVESIWETGKMPKQYQADDDKKPASIDKYSETEFSRWKGSTGICMEVCNTVFNDYPGNLSTDIAKDVKKLQKAPVLSDEEVIEQANKLIDEYSFKLNSKKINLLFDAKDMKDIETLRNKVTSLTTSRVAKLYAHFASWIAKITLQSEIGNIAQRYETKLFDSLKDIDTDLKKEFTNTDAVRRALQAAETNKGDKALKRVQQVEESKVPILPAITILHRARNYDWDTVRAKK